MRPIATILIGLLLAGAASGQEIIFKNGRAYRVEGGNPAPEPAAAESKPQADVVQDVAPPRITIIRRSSDPWIDPDIGAWSKSTLSQHLRGEIESPEHRGMVPAGELDGRSLSELKAIHANLHEGWTWDGSARRGASRVFDDPFMQSPCPNGQCPVQMRAPVRRSFFWRFR